MGIKCMAIGNRIMGDDSIGIRVAEEISTKLKEQDIEVIFGETDIDYTLNKIDNGDFIFIIDATYFGTIPGSITFTDIKEVNTPKEVFSQHQPSLINLVKTYKKSVKGFIIGIEVEQIQFSLELSDILENNLSYICEEVINFIHHTIRRINNA